MKSIIQAVKGTRDFYPEQMALRTWLYEKLRSVSESFGYQEYEAPILESLDLYAAKSGEELVKEQSYVFSDRGGSQIALRPELTPSLARMIAQKQEELTFPVRWWSFGPFWRYERPQKGRTREFFQWNVDILGADSPEADAENVAVLATFFRLVGLKPSQVLILVNNRRLMDLQFDKLGISKDIRPATSAWIDRKGKMDPEAWERNGKEFGLTSAQQTGIKSILKDKELWEQSDELRRFFSSIAALGLSEYTKFDPSIVRGLQYYTGTVFEAWEVGGEIKRSILGGGRYDNLLSDVGGQHLSGVGFAMGDVVMTLMLQKYGLTPENLLIQPASVVVTVFDQESIFESFKLASELRQTGLKVAMYPEPAKLPKQFKYADKIHAQIAVVLGPDEIVKNKVTIKNLVNGEQQTIEREAASQAIREILERKST